LRVEQVVGFVKSDEGAAISIETLERRAIPETNGFIRVV